MGVFRVLRGLFTASTQVGECRDDIVVTLTTQVMQLSRRVDELENTLSSTRVELNRFRGRVYAWKGHEIPPETPTEPAELPLTDPRVTKQEMRARLLRPGKPFKHN